MYQSLRQSSGQFRHVGLLYIDFASSCLNIAVSINVLNGAGVKVNAPREGHRAHRILFALVSLLIWLRCLYYMQLSDDISPLVRIIYMIFHDIQYFMVIFIILIIAFSNAFYLLGQNQVQFDGIDEDK